jgi:deoxyribodipyrimidine photolyase-related protein
MSFLMSNRSHPKDLPLNKGFKPEQITTTIKTLWLVLGDQLNPELFKGINAQEDAVWMAEVQTESTKVWSHKARIALFLSAMRHFAADLIHQNIPINYTTLEHADNAGTLSQQLIVDCQHLKPEQLIMVLPGEWDVLQAIQEAANTLHIPLTLVPDEHFLSSPDDFKAHATGRKQLRMEFFYREMRKRYKILMTQNAKPEGDAWNFDHSNQGSFGKSGPGVIAQPLSFKPDDITLQVFSLIEQHFPDHPGTHQNFDWPVTPQQAKLALTDFIQNRLPTFGQYQDAMWSDPLLTQPYLYHAKLAAALNLKLIHPLVVIQAAEQAYYAGHASLESVEGFIRQILGWREYVRGIYWLMMPDYREKNALNATQKVPDFYWTAKTEMVCLRETLSQTLAYGYAHHIQRLMVTGLFGLLLGVNPKAMHEWYLAIYVDAVEWVELPNTLGMSQYGDGGIMASKPYIASGKYIDKMSNYCKQCQYKPDEKTGDNACPFTTLYWDFLIRHKTTLVHNPRMSLQVRHLDRFKPNDLTDITHQAEIIRQQYV